METITKLDELIEQRVVQEEKISYMALPGIELIREEKRKKFREKYWNCRYNNFPLSTSEMENYSKGYNSIEKIVSGYFCNIDFDNMTRKTNICLPRQICQYYAFHLTKLSLQKIADKFGQNHANVINSEKKISNLLETCDKTWNALTIPGYRLKRNLFEKFAKDTPFSLVNTELEAKIIDQLIIDYKF